MVRKKRNQDGTKSLEKSNRDSSQPTSILKKKKKKNEERGRGGGVAGRAFHCNTFLSVQLCGVHLLVTMALRKLKQLRFKGG